MTDAYSTDNLTLLENTPAQAKYILHSLEQTEIGICNIMAEGFRFIYLAFGFS